jgi:antitoxin (DNA-binding transcriptional repressor) of toxin-antitoxin stability system
LADGQEIEITKHGKPVARLSPPRPEGTRKFDVEVHRRWMKETWGDRVFSAEEVREMREAELGDRSWRPELNAYPETSFLCGLYRTQYNSGQALAYRAGMSEPLCVTRLLLWEFRQSVRFQAYRHSKNRSVGYPLHLAEKMLANLNGDLRDGFVTSLEIDFIDILVTGERISKTRTFAGGHRGFDILHVATAHELGAKEFLSFDSNQIELAAAEGLATPLRVVS